MCLGWGVALADAFDENLIGRAGTATPEELVVFVEHRKVMGLGEAACLAAAEHRGWMLASMNPGCSGGSRANGSANLVFRRRRRSCHGNCAGLAAKRGATPASMFRKPIHCLDDTEAVVLGLGEHRANGRVQILGKLPEPLLRLSGHALMSYRDAPGLIRVTVFQPRLLDHLGRHAGLCRQHPRCVVFIPVPEIENGRLHSGLQLAAAVPDTDGPQEPPSLLPIMCYA